MGEGRGVSGSGQHHSVSEEGPGLLPPPRDPRPGTSALAAWEDLKVDNVRLLLSEKYICKL